MRATRREFLAMTAALPVAFAGFRLEKPLRLAVIADVHHGLASDALSRLSAFVEAVEGRPNLDAVIQMGDFCHARPESQAFLYLFNRLKPPKIHVLGNHDMDTCGKAEAMAAWGMPSRFGARRFGDTKLLTLDLNNLKKDGALLPYEKGNYFESGVTHNWMDEEQKAWLGEQLKDGIPTIVLSHQPLGFGEPGKELPPEQLEVLELLSQPGSPVLMCLSSHLHVDRFERWKGIPCFSVNSASYFWHQGMRAYSKPLYCFVTVEDGQVKVEGVRGEFISPPPASSDSVIGRSASITDRSERLPA